MSRHWRDAEGDKELEDQKVAGAIRTDFILSAEIMAIALTTITAPDLSRRASRWPPSPC